jgi:hypothetical protein
MMQYKPYLFLLIASTLSLSQAYGQKQNVPEENMYVDSRDRVYVKASKGVYFFISDSPDPSKAVPLKSEKTKELANPMLFDGHGKHYLIHEDLHEDKEVTFEVYADKYAPNSRLEFSAEVDYINQEEWFFSQSVEISQLAKDDLSGVKQAYISINGSPFAPATEAQKLEEEKTYVVTYYAVDQVGNVEAPKNRKITLDLSAPASDMTLEGDFTENTLSSSAKFILSSQDRLSGLKAIHYRIDDGPEKVYSGAISAAYLSEGSHQLHYFAIDQAGNREEIKSFDFFVDRTAPLVNAEVLGDSFVSGKRKYSSSRTKMKITALDNRAGVKAIYFSINNEPFQLYEKPFYLPTNKGHLNIRAYAVDHVNNKGEVDFKSGGNSDGIVYMDLNGPDLNYNFNGPLFQMRDTVYISKNSKIRLEAQDQESGLKNISYRIDGGKEKIYKEPFSIAEEGKHTVEYYGYDNVNNLNKATFYFVIDNTGPEIFSRPSMRPIFLSKIVEEQRQKQEVYAPHVSLFLSATDSTVGNERLLYSVNGGSFKPYTQAISGFSTGQTYHLQVKALDKLGNEAIQEITFHVE